MSKEAEKFFIQKTIENAKRPRMKKFLALVNREAEGKILQEYADKQLQLYDVSQQRELLKFFIETQASELFKTETGFKWREDMIEETIKNFNCG